MTESDAVVGGQGKVVKKKVSFAVLLCVSLSFAVDVCADQSNPVQNKEHNAAKSQGATVCDWNTSKTPEGRSATFRVQGSWFKKKTFLMFFRIFIYLFFDLFCFFLLAFLFIFFFLVFVIVSMAPFTHSTVITFSRWSTIVFPSASPETTICAKWVVATFLELHHQKSKGCEQEQEAFPLTIHSIQQPSPRRASPKTDRLHSSNGRFCVRSARSRLPSFDTRAASRAAWSSSFALGRAAKTTMVHWLRDMFAEGVL